MRDFCSAGCDGFRASVICVEIGGALVGPGPVAGGRRDDDEGEFLGEPAPHAGGPICASSTPQNKHITTKFRTILVLDRVTRLLSNSVELFN